MCKGRAHTQELFFTWQALPWELLNQEKLPLLMQNMRLLEFSTVCRHLRLLKQVKMVNTRNDNNHKNANKML